MIELPESAKAHCASCGRAVEPYESVIYEVVGFERERSQGGANHIIARRRTGRVVGPCCAHKVQRGEPIAQEALL